jgi:hypothetical protein
VLQKQLHRLAVIPNRLPEQSRSLLPDRVVHSS